MKIELIGSIYVFLLHYLFKNRYLRLAAIITYIILNKTNFDNYYLLFLVGIILFDFKNSFTVTLNLIFGKGSRQTIFVLIGFFIGLYLGAFPNKPSWWYTWFTKSHHSQAWHMLGSILLVASLLQSSLIQNIFGNKIGKFLGKISFVLYLIHLPIICTITSYLISVTSSLSYVWCGIISISISIIITLIISNYFYYYIDIYTTSLSRKIGYNIDRIFAIKKTNNEKEIMECI